MLTFTQAGSIHNLLRVSVKRPLQSWDDTNNAWVISVMAQVFVVVAAGSVIAFIIRDLGNASLAGWVIQVSLYFSYV
jgi:hypothetical protein